MRFITKLVVFACALTAAIFVFDLNDRQGRNRDRVVHVAAEGEDAVALVRAPHAVEAVHPVEAVHATAAVAVGGSRAPGEVRILTKNGAAFLALRDDDVVAGLSDSLREVVAVEMKKEMSKHESGIGGMIQSAVRSGVEKLLDKEISVPVSEIETIDYRGRRIVIAYKEGKSKRMISFDHIKNNDQSLLEQFSEEDARRLVEAVRVKITR